MPKNERLRLAAVEGERQRCLALVVAYRRTIERKFAQHQKPTSLQQKMVERVTDALVDIEREIIHPSAKENIEMVLPGDFSIEEIERAAAMIEEQERNPFEI